jgi:hypothetical protein
MCASHLDVYCLQHVLIGARGRGRLRWGAASGRCAQPPDDRIFLATAEGLAIDKAQGCQHLFRDVILHIAFTAGHGRRVPHHLRSQSPDAMQGRNGAKWHVGARRVREKHGRDASSVWASSGAVVLLPAHCLVISQVLVEETGTL